MILARPILPLLVVSGFAVSFAGNLPAADCNENGLADLEDLLSGRSNDCNQNSVPDECDILPQSAVFEVVSSARAGDGPFALAAADLNGDGDIDLVATNQESNDVTVFMREAAGFRPSTTLPVGRQPVAAAAGDLDGDGDSDFLVSNLSDRTISLLANDGTGGLTVTSFDSGPGLAELAVSDLDSDGDLDFAGTTLVYPYVWVFFNDGSGSFPQSEDEFVGDPSAWTRGIASEDLDGDGDADLCATNTQSSSRGISILWNDGAGVFTLDEPFLLEETYPVAVVASDVDGDGGLDLLAVGGSRIFVVPSMGAGTFGAPSTYPPGTPRPSAGSLTEIACADLTGDGFLDVATVDSGQGTQDMGGVSVFFGAGDGTLSGPRHFRAGGRPFDLAILEIDGDGRADIVTANWFSDDVTVLDNAVASNSADCDSSGVPDECEPDCDGDGIPDRCEISNGTATDSNGNGVSDLCERDCNRNGIVDDIDLSSGTSKDCNHNLVPDECDLAPALGSFAVSGYPAGNFPRDMVTGDLDGEGTNDLAVLGNSSEDVTVLLNTGGRSFRESRRYFAGIRPVQLASADLDGDEDIDLAVANGKEIVVFRNSGEGQFIRQIPLPGFESPYALEAADMDGDGDVDLVLGSAKEQSVAFYKNSGGSFDSPIDLGVHATFLSILDLDGDADLDLMVAEPFGLFKLVFNQGGGEFDTVGDGRGQDPIVFTEVRTPVVAGHLAGDGNGVDWVAIEQDSPFSGKAVVFLSQGPRSVRRAQVLEPVGGADDLALADVDQDQDLDLVVAGESVNVFVNNGAGAFAQRGSFKAPVLPGELIAADLDGDGAVDFAVTGSPHHVWVLWNRGDGQSPGIHTYAAGPQTHSVIIDDFDLDGDFDAAAGYSSVIKLLENSGQGDFTGPSDLFLPGGDADHLLSGDFNGDGYPDLAGATGTEVAFLTGSGGGIFASPRVYTAGDAISGVARGDLDADGDLDLAIANVEYLPDLSLSLLLNRGDGTFGDALRTVPVGASQTAISASDFDADGLTDLAVAIEGARIPHGIIFHRGLGSAEFTPGDGRPEHLTANRVSRLLAADLENDGLPDILSADERAATVSVFRNMGGGTFAPRNSFDCGGAPHALTAGDLDRDGYTDVVVAGRAQDLGILRNRGDGTFGPVIGFPAGEAQSSVALGYLDGDGDLDLAVAFPDSAEVGILLNQEGELAAMDCDRDGITDMFQLGPSRDCNGNDIPDEIDIHARRVSDDNGDGIPDQCPIDRTVFHRGDANGDGSVNATDSLFIFGFLFLGTEGPACMEAADTNNHGAIDITDGLSILSFLFLGTQPPAPPGAPPGACGADPDEPGSTRDLGCRAYAACEPAP